MYVYRQDQVLYRHKKAILSESLKSPYSKSIIIRLIHEAVQFVNQIDLKHFFSGSRVEKYVTDSIKSFILALCK